MSRPPQFPGDVKIRIVLSVLAGEMTVAEAARRNTTSETSVAKWKAQFLESGKAGVAAGRGGRPSSQEDGLKAEVEELKAALAEPHVSCGCERSPRSGWPLRGPRGEPHGGGDADLKGPVS